MAGSYVAASRAQIPVRYVMIALALGLIGYALSVWWRGRETLRDFGLRTDNLRAASAAVGAFTAAAGAAIAAIGWLRGAELWRPELAITLPLYPLYGVAQQLVVQGIFHRRLLVLSRSRAVSAALTAAAFGLLHTGNPVLFALTTAGGAAWAILYQRHPNVWALGFSHGLLGALAYPYLLGVDPLSRL